MTTFRPSDVRIYRPYPDEVPWELFASADESLLREAMDRSLLRVGKLGGEVLGAYALLPRSATGFELIALVVADAWRRRGLGRWLLGHAIGLAETKGGREITAAGAGLDHPARRFLASAGFEPHEHGMRLVLTPE